MSDEASAVSEPALDAIRYDPFDYEIDKDVHPVWRRMRDELPLYRNDEHDFWALSRYDDVLPAMLDTETFSSAHGTTLDLMGPDFNFPLMIFMDPPQHSWHRTLVSRAFTLRTVARLRERITVVCRELLDQLDGRTEFDVLEDYGSIIPPTMILALLGFPEGLEREWRDGVTNSLTVSSDGEPVAQPDAASTAGFGIKMFEVLPEYLERRRREPEDDLLSVLANVELDDGEQKRPLDEMEIFGFVVLLASAGTETVGRLLGWVATLLDQHPDQRRLLADSPDLIENAIEECLRYEAPSPVNGRWLTRDVEVCGQIVPKDSKLLLLNGSANRDDRHFPDGDRFDVRRTIDRHLSFGYGAHFCVGAALARLEGQIALRELLARHPSWEVDHDRTEMVHTATVRGYAKVPVRV